MFSTGDNFLTKEDKMRTNMLWKTTCYLCEKSTNREVNCILPKPVFQEEKKEAGNKNRLQVIQFRRQWALSVLATVSTPNKVSREKKNGNPHDHGKLLGAGKPRSSDLRRRISFISISIFLRLDIDSIKAFWRFSIFNLAV